MERTVREIPATITQDNIDKTHHTQKRKVVAYARVSTESEEQQSSYTAQVDYYTNYIQQREEWEFVGMYSDEGISGTSIKKREGFKRMISDALDGKIDLIITKSVSRFARNTVDSLTTIRTLKEKGVECYFEKENIWTFDGKGELLITVLSSLSQEESRSISENVTWGQRKRFSDGKVSVPFGTFLGYDRGEDGNLVINDEQAKIVRKIYKLFLQGYTPYTIAKLLTEDSILSPAGKEKWHKSTVERILKSEKYKGDALLQKSYTVDFLTKKQRENKGEVPQYYVENNHQPIIQRELHDYVQAEFIKRSGLSGNYSGNIFSAKLRCGECGTNYGAKVWHSNTQYRKVMYCCNNKIKCSTPRLTECEITEMFVKAVNQLSINKDELTENLKVIKKVLNKKDDLIANTESVQSRNEVLKNYSKLLKCTGCVVQKFDDVLWNGLLDTMTVYKGYVVFKFKDNIEIIINT